MPQAFDNTAKQKQKMESDSTMYGNTEDIGPSPGSPTVNVSTSNIQGDTSSARTANSNGQGSSSEAAAYALGVADSSFEKNSTLGGPIQANSTTTSSQTPIDAQAKKRAMLLDAAPVATERLGFNHRSKNQMNTPLRGVLKKYNKGVTSNPSDHHEIIQSSPLLTSTPPSISRALIRLYPYLIVFDKLLSYLTWTGDDIWGSVLLLCIYITVNLYFQTIVSYFGHFTCVLLLWLYSNLDRIVGDEMEQHPTLDDIIHTVSSVSSKFDLLLSPIAVLTTSDLKSLLITMVFLSPIYMIITIWCLPKGNLMLLLGVIGLSFHSSWSRVSRKMLWKSKTVRLLCFYGTGLDIDGIKNYRNLKSRSSLSPTSSPGLFSAVQKKLLKGTKDNEKKYDNKPIRFTYVLYENQRRWLGIGWTCNMLAYERCPWTDEFLNEAPDPANFKLPDDSSSGMIWRWVDKTWRLDLSNDGAIQLSSGRTKTTASPSSDEGFIYYDNTWKKPATDDTYAKYTRRRRWVRTAELIKVSETLRPHQPASSEATIETQGVKVQVGSSTSSGVNVPVMSKVGFTDLESVNDNTESSRVRQRKVSFSTTENVMIFDHNDNVSKNTPALDSKTLNSNSITESSAESESTQDDIKDNKNISKTSSNIRYSFSSTSKDNNHGIASGSE